MLGADRPGKIIGNDGEKHFFLDTGTISRAFRASRSLSVTASS